MNKTLRFLSAASAMFIMGLTLQAQILTDTLAFQDFEITPANPTWNFTGPVIYNSGYNSATGAPANSPLGIGGSRAWETTTNSGGAVLEFDNIIVPGGYDSVRVRFNLAAMNLVSSGGGPDNLDYVLVSYSIDNGGSFVNRIRVRGAINDNSYWGYDATGVAKTYYLPSVEAGFQPVASGLATTLGYSTCEMVFPGNIGQVKLRINARSSSSTDTWLVDNVIITGEKLCTNSAASVSAVVCGSYIAPSGAVFTNTGVYTDTIPNMQGCDSIISLNLIINHSSFSNITASACEHFVSPSGKLYTIGGMYTDTIPNTAGCDSIISINLTILQPTSGNITVSSCGNYTSPSGKIYSSGGSIYDTIPNSAGCDSIITIALTITQVNTDVDQSGTKLTAVSTTGSYQWYDCNSGQLVADAEEQEYTPTANGSYALIITENGCTDTSDCYNVTGLNTEKYTLVLPAYPNPASEYCTIDLEQFYTQVNLEVSDGTGRVVMKRSFVNVSDLQLDLQSLSTGMYIIRIALPEGGLRLVKLLKH